MCGRYSFAPAANFAERFHIEEQQLPLLPRYNVAPSQAMPVIVRNSPNRVVKMTWGLIPQELYTYTIITTTPNDLVAPIHNRMPAILCSDDEVVWLDKETDPARLLSLLAPYPAGEMEAYQVSRAVNNPANEGAKLMQPAATSPSDA